MVAIPLGLRAKLYIKPWASIAIAFFTLGFTFDSLIGQKDLENFKRIAFVNHNVYTNSYNALIEGCKISLVDADAAVDCRFFVENVKAADMSQPEQILSLIDQTTKYDAISKKKIKNFTEVFINKLADKPSSKDTKYLQDYKIGLSQVRQDIEQYYEDHFLLTRDNMNWKSFTLAQWTHNNWWSLISNLLILALFALYLEQRVGTSFLFLTYMSGGYVGMFLQAPFLGPDQVASGATANVMALVGAYTYFFFKEKIAISKLLIPVWFYALVFVALGNALYFQGEIMSNVILLSNVAGLAMGLMCGLVISWMVWVQSNFIFGKEQLNYFKAKKSTIPSKKISYMLEILEINPYNFFAIEYMFRSIGKYKIEPLTISKETMSKVCETMVRMVNDEFDVSSAEIYSLLALVPMSWNLTELPMPKLGLKELKKIETEILERDWRLGIRLYDIYITQHPEAKKNNEDIKNTVQKMMVHAESPTNPQSHQNIEWLRVYVIFNGKTALGQLIGEKYEDKTAAG